MRDGPTEEPGRPGHGQQGGDRSTTGGFAEDGDAVRVAAEGADVLRHPFQRGDLIEQTAVGGSAVDGGETLDAQTIIERHHDGATGRQPAAVEFRQAGRTDHVGAAGNPCQHR